MLQFYFPFSGFFNLFTTVIVGLFVLGKNPKGKTNQGFALYALSIVVWSLGYSYSLLTTDFSEAIFWNRILTLGSTWIPICYYNFVTHLLELKEKKYTIILYLGITLASLLTVANLISNLLVKTVQSISIFALWPVAGALYIPYLLMFFFYANYAVVLLWNAYKTGSAFKKKQIIFIFLGTAFGYIGGSMNYPLWFGIPLLPLGNIMVGIYPLLVGYSIIKYKLMEIDTVIHRTFLWLITSTAVFLPVFTVLYIMSNTLTALGHFALSFSLTVLLFGMVYYFRLVQPRIDHLFRRRKYDYYEVLGQIGQKIGSELDVKAIVGKLFNELQNILYIRNAVVLVQPPGGIDYRQAGKIGYDTFALREKEMKNSLSFNSILSQWINREQKILEKEQVEVNPVFESIKGEAMSWFTEYQLEIFIPIVLNKQVNGIIGIGKKENLQRYTFKDLELLEKMGQQIGVTIDNALHHEDIIEKQRLAEELKVGRKIQTTLLPQQTPEIEGLLVAGLMEPAKEIGGDYYDFIELKDRNRFAIVIGDASGKGVAAGLLMAMSKAVIYTISEEIESPKEILKRTNTLLYKYIGGQRFMSMLYLQWDAATKQIKYSSAGHEHILVYRSSEKKTEAILSGGFILGILGDIEEMLKDDYVAVGAKDKIVLYTDGVTEARNEKGEMYTLSRLQESVTRHGEKSVRDLIIDVKDEVYQFMGTEDQYDDITLVVMEVR